MWLPVALGVYDTLHPAIPAEMGVTMQLATEKDPGESETKLTLPVGVTFPPLEESEIVAEQLDG